MKFNKIFAIFVILSMFEHAQGESVRNSDQFVENKYLSRLESRFLYLNERINPPRANEENLLTNTKLNEDNDDNNYLPISTDSLKKRNFDIPKNYENLPKKLYFYRNHLKLSKSPDIKAANSKETPIVYKTFNSQKVYCRQIMKSELNTQGNIIDSVQHICDPLPFQTSTRGGMKPTNSPIFTSPYATHKEKRFERLVTSTPARGYNCRRVMNSELNERGEIVDSVVEVCDPPTTTTTTTRKPRLSTTTKATTTTPKPLVRVCQPVMNSYLNEKGEIIDSVTMVCKMEKVM